MQSTKVNRILSFFDADQKKSAILLISLMFIASIAELFGLGMVILMINSFLNIQNSINIPLGDFLNSYSNSINSLLTIFLLIFTFKFLIMILVAFFESSL